jgi:DNA-binding CsgD family transcriptional regulator
MITIDLADVEMQAKNFERADELYKESIILHRRSLLNHPPIPDILAKMARIAQIRSQLERSATLLGAAHTWGIGQTATLIPDIGGFESGITAVRAQMGPSAFDEAWAAGKAMTREQAIAYALADSDSSVEIPPASNAAVQPLTERELEILRLIADGLNSREVAEHLFLSVGTIRWYLKLIYSKLNAHSRSEALAHAKILNILT